MGINLVYQPGTYVPHKEFTDEEKIEDAESRLMGGGAFSTWGETMEALEKARAEQGPGQQFTIEFDEGTTITQGEISAMGGTCDLTNVTLQGSNKGGPHILLLEPEVEIQNLRVVKNMTLAVALPPIKSAPNGAPKPSPKYHGSNQRQRRRNRRRG